MSYYPISPDGFTIDQKAYKTEAEAMRALKKWVKNYKFQGHYTTARWERIPLVDLLDRCDISCEDPINIPF